MTLPTVAIGLGRTYASAARKPGFEPRSAGVFERTEEIDGVERVVFKLEGLIADWLSEERDCE